MTDEIFYEETAEAVEENVAVDDLSNENLSEAEKSPSDPENNCNMQNDDTQKVESENDLEIMKKELEALRRELDEKKNAFERIGREFGEFYEIFPDTKIESIPDSVWESVKSGIPLSAAYALYEKKTSSRSALAERINEKNSVTSTGSVGRNTVENFYTPDEVRAMTRSEVRKNYSQIIESMKKWN